MPNFPKGVSVSSNGRICVPRFTGWMAANSVKAPSRSTWGHRKTRFTRLPRSRSASPRVTLAARFPRSARSSACVVRRRRTAWGFHSHPLRLFHRLNRAGMKGAVRSGVPTTQALQRTQ